MNKTITEVIKGAAIKEIFNNLRECIIVIGRDYRITFANTAAVQLLGGAEEDIIGKKCHDFFHHTPAPCRKDDRWDMECPYHEVFKKAETVSLIHSHTMPGGAKRVFEITALPVRDEEGSVGHMVEILRDVTEKKEAEDALWESEMGFRTLADKSPNMIFINKRGHIVYVNRRCEEIMGYRKEEFYARDFNFIDLVSPEYGDLVRNNFNKHMRGEEVQPYEYKLVTKARKEFFGILTTKLIEIGGEQSILGIVTDITERKMVEEALKESEKKYRNIVDNALVGVYKTNTRGDILYVNSALSNMFEFESPEEMMKDNVLVRYEKQKDREILLEELKKTGSVRNFEVRLRTHTGKSKSVLLSATLDGDFISGMIIDISEKVKLDNALKQRIQDLEEFYNMAVGRELKMKELKKEITRLSEELKKYRS